VKDVEPFVQPVFSNIMKMLEIFEIEGIIFFIDKGEDDTLGEISRISKSFSEIFEPSKVSIITNEETQLPSRTERISLGRNALVRHVEENFSEVDYFVMMDSDDVSSGNFDHLKIEKYLVRDDWDSISFNRKNYYDIWALCYEPFIHHMWSFTTREYCLSVYNIMKEDIAEKLQKLDDGSLLECYSAFNGFAIYRTKKFLGCNYDGAKQELFPRKQIMQYLEKLESEFFLKGIGVDFSKSSNCEHASFHIQAINQNGAKIRISKEVLFD
jgi:hypothetical protein